MSREHYCGLWRSSAYEGMPYTDDFPEALLTFPEIIDGSIAQGRATEVTMKFEFLPRGRCRATVTDNGKGLASLERFKGWAAVKSVDNMHRNGHGLKKAMTKLEKDYDKAEWVIEFRKPNRDIVRITSPFMGPETSTVDVEDTEPKILMPSGTCWQMTFDRSVFGSTADFLDTFAFSIRELIETRYSEDILRRVRFRLDISEVGNPRPVRMNSHNNAGQNVWHNFKWWIHKMVLNGRARYLVNKIFRLNGYKFLYTAFQIHQDSGTTIIQHRFPRYYGCSRVHISLEDRMIEAIPMYKLHDRAPTSAFNGRIEFVKFYPTIVGDIGKMPSPCTTKVSFYEPDLVAFKQKYVRLRTEERIKSENKIAELEKSLAEAKAHHGSTLI